MKAITTLVTAAALLLAATALQAEPTRDCMLEGTIVKSERGSEPGTSVKFHSVGKYDKDSSCRVRRNEKMEFNLPEDTRLQEAPSGSSVKYRYRRDSDGQSQTQLISVGTSA